jgi:signal transduction histidine kinase
MRFHPSKLSLKKEEKQAIAAQLGLNRQNNPSEMLSDKVRRFILRLSIAKKISYGYSLAIGIAVFGTSIGLIIGDYYQEKAQKQLAIAEKQHHLLGDLENTISAMRSHPQRLVTVLGESIWFDYETAKFFEDVVQVNTLLSELESFIGSHSDHSTINATDLKNLLRDYKTNTSIYTQLIKSLWQQIEPANLKPEEIQTAQQQLLTFIRGKTGKDISVKFDRLSERLTQLKLAAATQQRLANDRLEQAETLRLQIIVISMVLSVAIAIILALFTSRAIARPLESVTQVAKAITQESNFNLRTPVTTEDEVGSLATSLNQLVQWVGEYTQELELARQTLEQRVEERTQELTQALQELKLTQAQLVQNEKMSSLGQMVAGIAHEINNPINFIYGNLEYARISTHDLLKLIHLYRDQYRHPSPVIQKQIEAIDLDFLQEDMPKVLSSLKTGAERIRKIVLSLRNFSRLDEAQIKSVDIHEGIENTLLLLNNRLKWGITVIKKYGYLPLVECYPAQLNQVFMNILTNAIDALEDVISSQLEENDNFLPEIVICTEMVDFNSIRVAIWDNGPGIPPEIRNKLFDPFFTTKPVGKGSGLGLAICYQIVEQHRGKIEVISEPGQGTEFAIALPIQTESIKA